MSGEISRVSFAVAGAQKCGTTALYRYLRGHPDLQLPRGKEAHFFDDEARDWRDPAYADYEGGFAPDGRRRGDATPIYLYWPQSLERMRRYNPDMRLVLIFRDPVARAWSHWRMEYASGRETEPFAWAIREGRARVDDPAAPGHHRVFSYVERGFYGRQLARALSLFPRGQVLLLRARDLKDEPAPVLAQVCDFLGVSPLDEVTPQLTHVSRELDYGAAPTEADVAHLRALYREDAALFESLAGFGLGADDAADAGVSG
ncbi:MAG: sulfotransferase [Caulobacteraceae bacterium]